MKLYKIWFWFWSLVAVFLAVVLYYEVGWWLWCLMFFVWMVVFYEKDCGKKDLVVDSLIASVYWMGVAIDYILNLIVKLWLSGCPLVGKKIIIEGGFGIVVAYCLSENERREVLSVLKRFKFPIFLVKFV